MHAYTTTAQQSYGMVNQPVIDLRITPLAYDPILGPDIELSEKMLGTYYEIFKQVLPPENRDPHLDSQLLYGETVKIVTEGKWLEVEAIEQEHFNNTKQRFEPIKGFVKNNQITRITTIPECNIAVSTLHTHIQTNNGIITLPMGTLLSGKPYTNNQYEVSLTDGRHGFITTDVCTFLENITEEKMRNQIVSCANKLVGKSYKWGGRGPDSIDCSGLINLSYRTCGIIIPRNAHCIYKKFKHINGNDLQPGDVIFFAKKDTFHVIHILLYCGDGKIIQSSTSKGSVIKQNDIDLLGKSISDIKSGDIFANYILFFGTLF